MPMPINLDLFFEQNNAGVSCEGDSPNQPCSRPISVQRKIYLNGGVPTSVRTKTILRRDIVSRQLKPKAPTLGESVKCHRTQARQLAKSRRAKHLSMRRPKKHVRFDSSAKSHDGMSLANENMQRLVLDYWHKKQTLAILEELLRDHKQDALHLLVTKMQDLLQRMQRSGDRTTLLLPRGGGRAIKLSKSHIPHINQLLKYAIDVRNECIRRCTLDLVLQDVPEFDADM